ncbi:MAG: hypothetical protein PHQ57_02440, partial [Candidatus Omnitrophica bacterium]|nr:hypothetical protein [Candidatus Omnitrophota bacterium]
LEVIGIKDGLPDKNEKRLFHVVSYSLIKGELEVKTLNTDLVSVELKSSEALKEAFLRNRDNKDLFINPDKFRRIKE